jgi:hypothetical protein
MTDIFTDYDDTIAAVVLRDPLGLQVIWSDLGQRIFQYRLTSISNDIRNFTINLFHHYAIRNLFEQNKLVLSEKQKSRFHNDSSLKMGLVLFLENLMVYSLFDLNEGGGDSVSLEGLLGSLNARTKWAVENHDPLISTNPEHELLVRQISLGINGRYKTPFMQMGISNRDYSYPLCSDIWNEIERLFSGGGKWSETLNQLKSVLEDIIGKSCRLGAATTNIELRYKKCLDIASDRGAYLRELYRDAFGNTDRIPQKVKKFLVNQTGLNDGAAGALFAALTNNVSYMDTKDYESVFSAALKEKMGKEQKKLLEDIIQVEPHLSRLSHVFDRICSPQTYSLDDIQDDVEFLLGISAAEVGSINDIRTRIAAGTTTSSQRLRIITDVLQSKDVLSFVSGLHEYHQEVMDFRNLPAWFSLRGSQINHGTKMSTAADDTFNFRHPRWIHDFYLNTLISLQRGIIKS